MVSRADNLKVEPLLVMIVKLRLWQLGLHSDADADRDTVAKIHLPFRAQRCELGGTIRNLVD